MSTIRDFRNLAYALCEQREVPLLVTDMIADCLVHRDLFNINTVSRSLNEQANAVIYRDVVVNLDGSKQSAKTASLLFRTLLTSKTAARAVRTLSLAGDPLQDWRKKTQRRKDEGQECSLRGKTPSLGMYADPADFTQGEIELYDKVATLSSGKMVSVWSLYLHVFRLTPHIQDFSVRSDYFRFPDFRSTLQAVAQDSSMEKLRSCSLCLDLLQHKRRHPVAVQDWDSALLALLAVPGIQSLAAVVSLKAEAVRQLRPGGSSITRLDLYHVQIQDLDLSSLLAATPSLRYLKYHASTDWGWLHSSRQREPAPEHDVGFEPLYNSLHHVSASLQELHMSLSVEEDSMHYQGGYVTDQEPPFLQREELSSLERLHALTIPYATLLGWTRKGSVWPWDKLLPSSLRRIVLTDNFQEEISIDPWKDEDLMPVFSSLVKWLSATRQGNEAAEFGLHLAIYHTEFNEPVRQELTRMCEERGVRCSIEKLGADVFKPPRNPPSLRFPLPRRRGGSGMYPRG